MSPWTILIVLIVALVVTRLVRFFVTGPEPFRHYRLKFGRRRTLVYYLYGSHSHEVQLLAWVFQVRHRNPDWPVRRWSVKRDSFWRYGMGWSNRMSG